MFGGKSDDFGEEAGRASGMGSGSRRRLRQERAQAVMEEAVSKRFTPTDVDSERCLARVFNHGLGGQCYSKRRTSSDFCGHHEKGQPHGLVTGPIPSAMVVRYLRAERKRILRSSDIDVVEGPRRMCAKPKQSLRCHWYARVLYVARSQEGARAWRS